ncbi:YfgM family protein [Arenimonas sp.]|jgi:predicted negative regulator of RcsB-dependent stress response|uniref:YfgM family protein n=1 Tax=Arenimonas sp. TaxID=1872635 RepID=UPI0037C0BA28
MSDQYDEHEQSERVKQWLLKNGSNLLTGILLIIAAISGWHWWQGRQAQQSQEAGSQYHTFVQAVNKPDNAKALVLGEAIIANYADSDFAFLAALRLSRIQAELGKYDLAAGALDKAAAVALNDQNRELVKIRKAQLLFSQGKTVEAAKAADAITAVAYPASLAELKGDLAMSSGKSEAAAEFYRDALQQLSADSGSRGLIDLKLTDAGGSADKPKEIR